MIFFFFSALTVLLHCHMVLCSSDPYPAGFITGGCIPELNDYPWIAGVHKKREDDDSFEQICGGTIINARFVLSAAHCFRNNGEVVPLELYRISAGNFFRNPRQDYAAQVKEVKDVIFHERYRDIVLNYAHDIVIMVLKEELFLSYFVRPIAIDWNSSFNDNSRKGEKGTVVGWHFTDRNEESSTRVAVELPFVSSGDCTGAVPEEFRAFLTPDKFCAGLRNGTAVCPGDGGAGLAFFNASTNLWYLQGIAGVGVRPKGNSICDTSQYSVFTSISYYRTWLNQTLSKVTLAHQGR